MASYEGTREEKKKKDPSAQEIDIGLEFRSDMTHQQILHVILVSSSHDDKLKLFHTVQGTFLADMITLLGRSALVRLENLRNKLQKRMKSKLGGPTSHE